MHRILRTALIQQNCHREPDQNLARSISLSRAAADAEAGLIVLPELHRSRYFCQTEDPDCFGLAEPIPGPSTDVLCAFARDAQVVLVASLFERRAPGLCHSTAVVIERDGTIAGRYRKMHIPDDPGYYEKFYFTPGDLGFRPIETSVGKLGVLVCWDQWFPEAARLMALAGADLLIYPTAIGWDPRDDAGEKERQLDAWVTIQRSHAIANGIPCVAVNRVGLEPDPSGQTGGIHFWGNSFAAGPQGECLVRGEGDEVSLLAELDLSRSDYIRRIWPFMRDRRVNQYGDLIRIHRD